ncbi:class I SAM-dependent methyltransferase [Spirillospora sp. NBC_00431]
MYGDTIAEIYELIHEVRGKDYRREAEDVARHARARSPGARSLLDVACGTGGHLRAFAQIFDHVEGLELSGPMVRAARTRLPGITVHRGDMRELGLGRTFDVITCMFGSIGYLTTVAELTAVLRRFGRHLNPGGVAAVDPWWFPERFADGHISADIVTVPGRTVGRVSHSTLEGGASRMNVHYIVADAEEGARHLAETHLITLFTRREYEESFAAAGFEVDFVEGLNDGRGLFVGAFAAASA